jgi:hypothetical protein
MGSDRSRVSDGLEEVATELTDESFLSLPGWASCDPLTLRGTLEDALRKVIERRNTLK